MRCRKTDTFTDRIVPAPQICGGYIDLISPCGLTRNVRRTVRQRFTASLTYDGRSIVPTCACGQKVGRQDEISMSAQSAKPTSRQPRRAYRS
jgi:hypothetical protein